MTEALRYGYHRRLTLRQWYAQPRLDEREALPAAVQRVAYGPSGKGGCLKSAQHQLVGHHSTRLPRLQPTDRRRPGNLPAHPEVRDALRRWHTCMAKAGYDYPPPVPPPATSAGKRPESHRPNSPPLAPT
ncbi:hypothetical protein ABZ851_31425 [Streptomyces sp. NPDC047049]|uniref:hypothetical protein n=1 Tax=Streptomyces sp. NPDC047049 TaxID=3156688 RepID=UPI0033F09704